MHIINLFSNSIFSKANFSKSILVSSMLMISSFAMAEEAHELHDNQSSDSSSMQMNDMDMSEMDHSSMNHESMSHKMMDHSQMQKMDHAKMNHSEMSHAQTSEMKTPNVEDHSQHQHSSASSELNHSNTLDQEKTEHDSQHSEHNHRAEHGGQMYAVTILDHKWLVNDDGQGILKSELETRIGTDENKLFIKIDANKQESHEAEFDAKVLYSRMISDFWDAQVGVRYRFEKVDIDHHRKDTEEKLDAVIGLHGLAPYFFETDAYLYVGQDNYSGFSLETERDLLLTQKFILKPYLDLDIVFSDDSKYAKKSGFSNVTTGIEARYEISKKIMPYIDVAYEYSKGNAATNWQVESDSKNGWLYGAGVRFRF